jgi:hypothetical protein
MRWLFLPEAWSLLLAGSLALAAWPAWSVAVDHPLRQAWWAALVASSPVLLNLFILPVAELGSTSKIAAASWRMMRRMGLVLGLALALFYLTDGWLTGQFWLWLVGFYQGTIILDGWLWWTAEAADRPRRPSERAADSG